jgi:hypothetical protein
MKKIQSFAVFEAQVTDITIKRELPEDAFNFLKEYASGKSYSIVWNNDKIQDEAMNNAFERAADEYLDSDDFREYTEECIRADSSYDEVIERGDEDEIQELIDQCVKDQTYWSDFIDGGILNDLMDEEHYKITQNLNPEEYTETEAEVYVRNRGDVKEVSIYGNLNVNGYEESFFPDGVVISGVYEDDDLEIDMEYEELADFMPTGEFSLYKTNIIALDRGPEEVGGYYCKIESNPRLISLESIQKGLRSGGDLEIYDNFLDEETLMKSYGLGKPGSDESVEYYLGLIEHEKFPEFDEEQLLFTMGRIGAENLQKRIDEDPAGMAVKIGKHMRVINSVKGMEGVKFPSDYSDDVEDFGDLKDLGF